MSVIKNVIFIMMLHVAATGLTLQQVALSADNEHDTVSSAPLTAPIPGVWDMGQITSIPGIVDTEQCESISVSTTDSNKQASKKPNNLQLNGPIIMHKVIPIILEDPINSNLIRVGQEIKAKLKENLYYGSHLIAPANSILSGHITSCRNGRTLASSLLQTEDRSKVNAAIEIKFENLVTDQNHVLPINGRPVHQECIKLGSDGFFHGITVNHEGKIIQGGRTLSREQKNTYKTLRVATNLPLPASILINLTAAPVVMGAVGAASPEVAFNKPVDSSVSHKRLKGMAYGVVTNLPGAFFVQAVIEKGNEIILNTGDELMIDLIVNEQWHQFSSPSMQPETLSVKAELLSGQN